MTQNVRESLLSGNAPSSPASTTPVRDSIEPPMKVEQQTFNHCPRCDMQHSPYPSVVVGVEGRPSAGKSEWIAAVIWMVQQFRLPRRVMLRAGVALRWVERVQLYQDRSRPRRDGITGGFLTPISFTGERDGWLFKIFKHCYTLAICDSSGEVFSHYKFDSNVRVTLKSKRTHVFVVDPVRDTSDGAQFMTNPAADFSDFLTQLSEYLENQTVSVPLSVGFVMTKLDQVIRASKRHKLEGATNQLVNRLREIDEKGRYDAFERDGRRFVITQQLLRDRSEATIDFLQELWPAWDIRGLQKQIQDKCGPNAGWFFPMTTVSFDEADAERTYSEVTDPRPYGVLEPLAYLAWTSGHIDLNN